MYVVYNIKYKVIQQQQYYNLYKLTPISNMNAIHTQNYFLMYTSNILYSIHMAIYGGYIDDLTMSKVSCAWCVFRTYSYYGGYNKIHNT